jgi:hypothetical protein
VKNTLTARLLFWGMLSLYFVLIGYEVLSSDYLFTDEAYRLWHNVDRQGVFADFHTQGRTLGGALVRWLFERTHTVTDVRKIRLLSLAECLLLVILLYFFLKRWQRRAPGISEPLIYVTVAVVASSLPFTIWIGWGVSVIIPLAAVLSLWAGLVLYQNVVIGGEGFAGAGERGGRVPGLAIPAGAIPVGAILGVASLFFYQSPYPLLLLPFYLRFLTRRDGVFDRTVARGIVYYLVIMAIYFGLFKLGLRITGMEASSRTGLATNPLERLSFFFSNPMNQAFSGNIIFDVRSIVSQTLFPVLLPAWLFMVFRYRGQRGVGFSIRFVMGLLLFWILSFLPQLASHENFAPYRTMLVLTIMVMLALADAILERAPSEKVKVRWGLVLVLLLLAKGVYNYKTYMADPLSEEYRIVKREVSTRYHKGIRAVIFILAPENGFKASFGIGSFKDEFGLPSTHKDWTPEPLVKQLVYEMTGSREEAEGLTVELSRTRAAVREPSRLQDPEVLVIDMPALLLMPPAGQH